MMLVGVTVAAGVAGVRAATSMRDRIDETDLAAEIANDVLQRAEALGCGLPIGYNEIGAAERLAVCAYDDNASGASGLGDVDYTAARGDRRFDVALRMEWNLAPPVPSGYSGPAQPCNRQVGYANALADPAASAQPTVLTRTVTVASEDTSGGGPAVTLTARQAVQPHLAPPGAVLGLMVSESGLEGREATLERTVGGTAYRYRLHGDSDDCAWFPYLEGVDYTLTIGSTTRSYDPLSCADGSATGVCHRFVSP